MLTTALVFDISRIGIGLGKGGALISERLECLACVFLLREDNINVLFLAKGKKRHSTTDLPEPPAKCRRLNSSVTSVPPTHRSELNSSAILVRPTPRRGEVNSSVASVPPTPHRSELIFV